MPRLKRSPKNAAAESHDNGLGPAFALTVEQRIALAMRALDCGGQRLNTFEVRPSRARAVLAHHNKRLLAGNVETYVYGRGRAQTAEELAHGDNLSRHARALEKYLQPGAKSGAVASAVAPERALAAAILVDAIRLLSRKAKQKGETRWVTPLMVAHAESWVLDTRTDGLPRGYTFTECCYICGYDPSAVRAVIAGMLDGGRRIRLPSTEPAPRAARIAAADQS